MLEVWLHCQSGKILNDGPSQDKFMERKQEFHYLLRDCDLNQCCELQLHQRRPLEQKSETVLAFPRLFCICIYLDMRKYLPVYP